MTHRQLIRDVGLSVLLAVPTLALAAPGAKMPTIPGVVEESPTPPPLVQVADRASERRG
jgi:hypothetical protein